VRLVILDECVEVFLGLEVRAIASNLTKAGRWSGAKTWAPSLRVGDES
jgi:hypothetical protein